jgi:hypothetical protein
MKCWGLWPNKREKTRDSNKINGGKSMSGSFEDHVDRRVREMHERMMKFKQRKKQMKQV